MYDFLCALGHMLRVAEGDAEDKCAKNCMYADVFRKGCSHEAEDNGYGKHTPRPCKSPVDPGEASIDQRLADGEHHLVQVRLIDDAHGVQSALDYAVYDLLDRITLFPVQDQSKWTDAKGNVLPDAFLLPRDATPVDLAYAVHSDIGDGYLHAVDARSEREIGDSRELEEGDVVKIVSTAK